MNPFGANYSVLQYLLSFQRNKNKEIKSFLHKYI